MRLSSFLVRRWLMAALIPLVIPLPAASADGPSAVGTWTRRGDLPDPRGLAGMFAGVSGGALIAAGGAKFPAAPPWEGGRKTWTDRVFVLERPDGQWIEVQDRLPRPLGYGVSAVYDGALIIAGGESPTAAGSEPRREVFALRWNGAQRTIVREELPPLPVPVWNACGEIIGSRLYVAGGATAPTVATKHFWSLDLAAPADRWEELPAWNGPPRMLAVSAVVEGKLYLLSGAELSAGPDGKPARRFLRDAHRYDPVAGWTRLADLPWSTVAAPSPAPVAAGKLFLLGGDDGSQFLNPPQEHTGFLQKVLRYDPAVDRWDEVGPLPAPRVTVPAARWGEDWFVISGEEHPGIRSRQVWSLRLSAEPGPTR